VRNALRSIQEGDGSRIGVFVRVEPDAVAVGVEDDGPGVAPAELGRIFDRFYRGAAGREGPSTGSGLGLTIARRIVTSAGGTIAAEPVAPRGLRVVARLPPAEPDQRGGSASR